MNRFRVLIGLGLVIGLVTVMPPVTVRAVITVTEKLVMSSTSQLSSFDTTSGTWTTAAGASTFSLASGTIGVCFVGHTDTDTAEAVATLTHNSVGWTLIDSQQLSGGGTYAFSVWYVAGAQSSSGIVAAITGGDNQTGMNLACYEVADSSGAPLQFKKGNTTAQTTHTLTMDNARTANSILLSGFIASDLNANRPFTAEYAGVGTGSEYTTPSQQIRVQWDIGGADTTPTWTNTGGNATTVLYAVEFAQTAGGSVTPCLRSMMGLGKCD